MKKATVKYQLQRDGDLYQKIYDRYYEAISVGDALVMCGWIKEYKVIPVKAVWIKC